MTARFRKLTTLIALLAAPALASPEYARRTQKDCNYCHPANSYKLNDAGTFYRKYRTLKGYVPPPKPDADPKANTPPPTVSKQPGHA